MSVECWDAELVLDASAELGEGPHWDRAGGELVWVDIPAGAVHRLDPEARVDRSFEVGQPVGAAVPRRDGGFVLALRDGLAVVDGERRGLRWLARVEAATSRTRMNDGACDASGRFWAGTMDIEEVEPIGSLYRLSAGRRGRDDARPASRSRTGSAGARTARSSTTSTRRACPSMPSTSTRAPARSPIAAP